MLLHAKIMKRNECLRFRILNRAILKEANGSLENYFGEIVIQSGSNDEEERRKKKLVQTAFKTHHHKNISTNCRMSSS